MDDGFIMAAEEKMKAEGVTSKELAERCGFATEAIERMLDGKISIKVEDAATMAAVLGLSLDEVFGILKREETE